MMYRYLAFAMVLVLMLFSIPGCGPMSPQAPNEVTLTEADSGKPVELAEDGTLTVNLPGNPTTGYTWEVQNVDSTILQQQGEPDFKAESDALGAPGMVTLTFKAEGTGSTDLLLVYHQPFDKATPPAKTFEAKVTVK